MLPLIQSGDSVKDLKDICLEQDLVDIWRVRNPTKRHFTWRTEISHHSQTVRFLAGR